MAGEHLKTPLATSLNAFAARKVYEGIQATGRSLPCSIVAIGANGAIVTVNFEVNATPFVLPQLTVPVLTSQYVRLPLQVGDLGIVISADTFIGNVSGLGSGTPSLLVPPGNLSALVFVPIGNANWAASADANAVDVNGPDGVILRATGGTAVVQAQNNKLGFFGTSPITKETVIGALSGVTDANAKAVLTSLVSVLAAYGILTNGTT
jgi:hypothetical protein